MKFSTLHSAGSLLQLAAYFCITFVGLWLIAMNWRNWWPNWTNGSRFWRRKLRYAGVVATIVIAFVLGFATDETLRNKSYGRYRDVKVLERRSPWSYQFFIDRPQPRILEARFCQDWVAPPFETGMTLGLLQYQDRSLCWSIAPPKGGYTILRDGDGKPI